MIKTHRDGFPWFSARRAGRGDARHRKAGAPSTSMGTSARVITGESHGKPPSRSRPLIAESASGSLDDVPHRPRLPSYPPIGPTDRLRDLYGSLSLILGIMIEGVSEQILGDISRPIGPFEMSARGEIDRGGPVSRRCRQGSPLHAALAPRPPRERARSSISA